MVQAWLLQALQDHRTNRAGRSAFAPDFRDRALFDEGRIDALTMFTTDPLQYVEAWLTEKESKEEGTNG